MLVKIMMGLAEKNRGKGILKINLLGQEAKELFCKTKKVYIEIFNIYHLLKYLGN